MLTPQTYRDYLYRWVLFKDTQGLLKGEQKHYGASGEYVVGYPYIDHQAGISMWVHYFCQMTLLRQLKVTGEPAAQKSALILRFDTLAKFQATVLTPEERKKLYLPDMPAHIENYAHPEVEEYRNMKSLDHVRAPGFPDDIMLYVISQQARAPEQIWGRIERKIDETYFECTLLNEPNQALGVHRGDLIRVSMMELVMPRAGTRVPMPVCMLPSDDVAQSGEGNPTGEQPSV